MTPAELTPAHRAFFGGAEPNRIVIWWHAPADPAEPSTAGYRMMLVANSMNMRALLPGILAGSIGGLWTPTKPAESLRGPRFAVVVDPAGRVALAIHGVPRHVSLPFGWGSPEGDSTRRAAEADSIDCAAEALRVALDSIFAAEQLH